MNVSGDSNENRDGLGWLISLSFGASLVTGRISGGPSLDQSRERTQADTEVEASRGGVESSIQRCPPPPCSPCNFFPFPSRL